MKIDCSIKLCKFNFKSVFCAGYADVLDQRFDVNNIEIGWINIGDYTLVCGDFLYFDQLTKNISSHGNGIFCASHTHFSISTVSPAKSRLGKTEAETVTYISEKVNSTTALTVSVDRVLRFHKMVEGSVYRRHDFKVPVLGLNGSIRHPNPKFVIDKSINIFVFQDGNRPRFCLVHHANHPVFGFDREGCSSDYVGVLRESIRQKFNIEHVFFILGACGDIRPNLSTKRIKMLPHVYFNNRFCSFTEADDPSVLVRSYSDLSDILEMDGGSLESLGFCEIPKYINGLGMISVREMFFNKNRFEFWPFEVSAIYQNNLNENEGGRSFIVSCVDDVVGYLPHRTQLVHGGYEVNSSRFYFGLKEKLFYE